MATDNPNDETGQCERCESAPATSKFRLGANRPNPMYSTFRICNDCTRSLGEWFDNPAENKEESAEHE